MDNIKKILKETNFVRKEIMEDVKNGSEFRWQKKKVAKTHIICDGGTLDNVTHHGIGEVSLSNEMVKFGKSSLLLKTNTRIENIQPRPTSSISINCFESDWSEYNRISVWIYPKSIGFQNFYFHITLFSQMDEEGHCPSLTANEWNHIIWETDFLRKHKISRISITPFLMGCPPEAEPEIEIFVNRLAIQKVDEDYFLGWDLEDRIAYCHSGYFIDSKKKAIVQYCTDSTFSLYNSKNVIVYSGNIQKVKSDLGEFYELDFSSFNKAGNYYLKVDNKKTEKFAISSNPYESSVWKSINFLRLLRCGEDIAGVHSACHLNCRSVHPDGRTVPNFGGWHDAGDVSQFEICTAEMAHAILDLYEALKDKNKILSDRLLEEAKVGIDWLLRTRFNDGMRALAVSYSIWRDNVLAPDNKTVEISVADNGPFENFCAAAAEAVAYRCYKEEDKVFADWCLRAAIADFEFAKKGYQEGIYTKRWGPNIDSQVCGDGILAACELYRATRDNKYIDIASEYAEIVMKCQQIEIPNWQKPIRGFFYEDQAHTKILTYEHRGHEQTPIQGLVHLMEVAPEHVNYKKWENCIDLYSEYVTNTINVTYPYNLLPGHVYDIDKINVDRFTINSRFGTKEEIHEKLKKQATTGIKLDERIFLRIFPIALQRRGYHATLLSKTKAVSEIARLKKDKDLMKIAIDQLEWILGKNPFASSTMYGEGHNYHPLYVAFSRQMVGSLPVGIRTLDDFDLPHWPTRNGAVYKEIWGHTTGKYLWVLADLYKLL